MPKYKVHQDAYGEPRLAHAASERMLSAPERQAQIAVNRAVAEGKAAVADHVQEMIVRLSGVPIPSSWDHALHPVVYVANFPHGQHAEAAKETLRAMEAVADEIERTRLEEGVSVSRPAAELLDEEEASGGGVASDEEEPPPPVEPALTEEEREAEREIEEGPPPPPGSEGEEGACPHCDFVAGSPQGLGSHIRAKHPEADTED